MKKALSLLLVFVMLISTMPMTVLATEVEHTHTYENGICTGCGAEKTVIPYDQLSTVWPSVNTDLTHIICYGQSFSVGADAPYYADPAVDGVYVFGNITNSTNGTALSGLTGTTKNQHPIVSTGNVFAKLLAGAGIDTDIILGSYGSGGRTIAQLMSAERQAEIKEEDGYTYDILSSGRYEIFQSSVSALAQYAQQNQQSISCPAIVYLQGETDQNTDAQLGYPENPARAGYGAGGDKEKYKEYMSRLKEDMQREVMEQYGQTEKPLFVIYQVSGTYTRTDYSSINMAQLEFAQENKDVVLVQSPYFTSHYTNSHHLTQNGYRWLGEYIGRSLYTALVEREKPWPMLPTNFTVENGNTVRISISGVQNGLTIDTYTVENATDSRNLYGFCLEVDGARIKPASVTVSGDEIIVTLPQSVNLYASEKVYLIYAGRRASGTGNIRDNCTEVGFYDYLDDSNDTGTGNNQGVSHSSLDVNGNSIIGQKYPLYNWLAAFCYEVEVPEVEIPEATPRQAAEYHWEMQETGLVSITDGNAVENNLTLLQGSVESGVLKKAHYSIEKTIVLQHDLPWVLEWKAAGNGNSYPGGKLLSASKDSDSVVRYLYLPADSRSMIAWGVSSESGNFGFKLSAQGIDIRKEHIYRIENRIAEDGVNTVYLIVDGVEIGAMVTGYRTSSSPSGSAGSMMEEPNNWANGRDIYLGYLGEPSNFLLNNMKLSYLKVWENGISTGCGENESSESMSLRYDDHLDMSGKTVEIIDAGKPTSYLVGYGVEENTVLDTAVVTLEGDTLVATGIGTATVKVDGETYEITVTAAPISLLLLIGQSNMQGIDGNANESIVCPTGQVYATYADRYKKTVEDVTKFAPSALTGEYRTINVTGDNACLENYPVNMLTEAGNGREGMDSGIAYEWTKQTGEKVWTVNVGYGGSSIKEWQEGGVHYQACLELFNACQETLRKEIAAGHFTLSHMAYFWCQGCADENQTAEWYVDQFLTMHDTLKTDMSFDKDTTFEFAGIVPIRSGHNWVSSYRAGVYKDSTNVPYYQSFKDLQFNGPRVAQYWMGNNPELFDIWNVCTIQEGWATLPDGTDGVADYFESAYKDGIVDYPTQVTKSDSWRKPTTPAAVHDNIHYNQIGYNELGRESARNALIMLGEISAPNVTPEVKFLTWDGFTSADTVIASPVGVSGTLVVPMVYPVWKSKDVTYTVSEGLRYEYYDLLAETVRTEGTLTASNDAGTITVAPRELTSFRWELDGNEFANLIDDNWDENTIVKLAGSVTDGVFNGVRYKADKPVQLLHNETWCVEIQMENWTATAGSMILSSSLDATQGIPYFYFRPKDCFIGIGCYNGSTYDNYGVSLKKHSIACSEGVHTYRFVNRVFDDGSNMIYLIVDNQEIGALTDHYVNSTLIDSGNTWLSGKNFAMPYLGTTSAPISNCTINYIVVIETNYNLDMHLHNWSGWELVSAPSCDGPGEEKRVCSGCGETQTRKVEGVWQILKLSEHMTAMPDKYCCDTNLWTALEHDKYYFATNSGWSVHHTGTVYSVTIPINAGDWIFATSFGAVGDNGGAKNGIITTFFNADGVEKTLMPADTYAEFVNNGGYLIAPEGAVAINIPMWNNSEENEIYILNRDHTYENGVCTVCGAEHPNLANYEGKVISILGDSISTFAGYIPVADGFNLKHYARYPQDNLFTEVEHTWWMQVLTALDAKLGINESWRSTEVYNYIDAEVNSSYDGTKACMASITRIQNLGSNGTPDVILFYGGTNDITQRRPVGSFDPATAPTEVDLISVKWDTVADAYVDAIMRMQHYYPNAEIVAMLPTFTYKNTDAVIEAYNSVFAAICEHYGVTYVDLRECGISTSDLPDGTHPNATGMDYITAAVMDVLMSDCDVEAGEHIVHSVTHNLTGAESSLSYYKGISHGNSFVTTITGENLKVTVTMGGTDITADCYTDGVVSIEKVTGDIVITAKGIQKTIFDDYLQGLPENLCSGTNLWTELKPINLYYTTSGWGLNASGSAYSITIPISEGDKIWATSFQKSGTNGGTGNGIRLTWFDADGVLRSLSPTETYAEFIANGYLTAPEGAVAVNVVMWNGNESNEIYILNRDHCYKDEFDAFCDGCNAIREINYPAESVELREIDGVKYIYVNGRTSVEGLFKVGDDYYCATWGGVVLTGDQYVHLSYCDKPAGRHFYFSEDGKMLDKGFVTGDDGIKRLYVDGRTSVEGLFEVDGKYYLATWGGVVLTDGRYYISESFVDGIDGGRNFTVGSDGKILDGVVEIDGQKYCYDFGTTVFPGIYEIDGIEYTVTWGGLIEE